MQTFKGNLQTNIFQIIPLLLFVSVSTISNKKPDAKVYAIHITPWFEIGFNWRA